MKIAIIGSKGIPARSGGIERHVEELSSKFEDLGMEVFVYSRKWFTRTSDPVYIYNGVNIIYTPSIRTKHLDTISHVFFSTVHALFRKYDVIHYHGVGPALMAWLPRIFRPGMTVVTTFHCIDRKHQKWGWFARQMLRLGEWCACKFAHRTITVSKVLQQYVWEAYEAETEYIPNGVNLPARKSDWMKEFDILKEFDLRAGRYFIIVARLVRHKGIHIAVEAFKKFKHDYGNSYKLVVVGDSAFTDDYVTALKIMVGNDPDIIFTGYRGGKELEALYRNAYLMIHPSESEGLPIAVLEGMSYGLGILASDIYENIEVTGGYGILFQNRNVNDLKNKLADMARSPEMVKSLGEKSREHVKLNYNWDEIAKKTVEIYRSKNSIFTKAVEEAAKA